MPKEKKFRYTCCLICEENSKSSLLIESLKEAVKESEGKLLVLKSKKDFSTFSYGEIEFNDISRSDILLVESNYANPDVFYWIGLAHAFGKPIVPVISENAVGTVRPHLSLNVFLTYSESSEGLKRFKNEYEKFVDSYLNSPQRFQVFFPYANRALGPSYIIDLDKLDPREYENLCFELISQMGFQKVSWGIEIKDVDVVATLPKKDPDNFEYEELWFILTRISFKSDDFLRSSLLDTPYFYNRISRIIENPDLFSRTRVRVDGAFTILLMLRDEESDYSEKWVESIESTFRRRKFPLNIRVRVWTSRHLVQLIQRYPQIAYKYFSEQSRGKSKYRKSIEEFYQENIILTEALLKANTLIEEEKKKRFVAERDAAWKDVAYKAAHKLGNPVDATDNFLQSLVKAIQNNNLPKATDIAKSMDETIEEAKFIIGQFKSLTKIDEINAQPYNIVDIVESSCKIARERGVTVEINLEEKLPNAFIDPQKTRECFDELVANSLHWFDKPDKQIVINITKVNGKKVPEQLDQKSNYLKINFSDNGKGVSLENKEKIFSPFFTTYHHGTGLGLSIVKRVIESENGWILENGKSGDGASFEIYLPVAKAAKTTANN